MTSYPDTPTDYPEALENAQQMVRDFDATMQAYRAFLEHCNLPVEYWLDGMRNTLIEHVGNFLNDSGVSYNTELEILRMVIPERAIPFPVEIPGI